MICHRYGLIGCLSYHSIVWYRIVSYRWMSCSIVLYPHVMVTVIVGSDGYLLMYCIGISNDMIIYDNI
jgi:hypothetical protein